MSPVEAGPDRGHVFVQVPVHNMVAGSVKATMCILTSVTATPAPVSYELDFHDERIVQTNKIIF